MEPKNQARADEIRERIAQIDADMARMRESRRALSNELDDLTLRRKVKKSNAMEWLAAELADGPLRSSEIRSKALEAGHSTKTLRRAADALGVLRMPPGGGPKCEWALPPQIGKVKPDEIT